VHCLHYKFVHKWRGSFGVGRHYQIFPIIQKLVLTFESSVLSTPSRAQHATWEVANHAKLG